MHACKIIVYQLTSCTENCVVVTCSFCWLHVASWIGHNVIDHACAVIVLLLQNACLNTDYYAAYVN